MHVKPVRYQDQRCLHFITFSCYRRMRLLDWPAAKGTFERTLERVRVWYGCYIVGYVVMLPLPKASARSALAGEGCRRD